MPNESVLTIWHPTIFGALAPASAMRPVANSNRFSFSLVTLRCKRPNGTSDAGRTLEKPSMIDFESHPQTGCSRSLGLSRDNPVYHVVSKSDQPSHYGSGHQGLGPLA